MHEAVEASCTLFMKFTDMLASLIGESLTQLLIFATWVGQHQAVPHHLAEHRLHITPSIGIAVYPDDARDSESVVRNADMAMYHAKKKGRNTYAVFRPEMNALAIERQTIEEELHHAIEQHKLILHLGLPTQDQYRHRVAAIPKPVQT